jgi:hypothetical protein
MEITYLAVVKSRFDSEIVNICICDGSHLRFLDRRNATFWVKDEDRDIGLIPQTIDGGAFHPMLHLIHQDLIFGDKDIPSGISTSSTNNGQLLLFLP